jgi:hypothetical protein
MERAGEHAVGVGEAVRDLGGTVLGPASSLETAPSVSVDHGVAPGRAASPSVAVVGAALLLLAVGVAVYAGARGGRSSVVPAAVRSHGFSGKGLLSLPLAAQGPVSAALGADSAAYRFRAHEGGLTASSPTQHLAMSFAGSGISLSSGATHVGLRLRGIGYGNSLTALGAVAPRIHANRVLYARPGLSEWYANGPLGLEQGFTVARAPARHLAGPLTISMTLSGNVHASLADGGQSITLSRAGTTVLRYTGLSASDARGLRLRSWLQLDRGRLLLRVDAKGARYPLRIDPFMLQGSKLTGTGEIGDGEFGDSVALSADGNTALVGGPVDNGDVGAVWVFTRTGGNWSLQEKLTAPTSGGEEEVGPGTFGASVALSSDGDRALIGGPQDNGGAGAAWYYVRSGFGGSYILKEKVFGGGEPLFGFSVALSSDGATALIGAGQIGLVGAARVYTLSNYGYFLAQAALPATGEVNNGGFGYSVALSSDGNTAIVGGCCDEQDLYLGGAAWVYTRSGTAWTFQEKLTDGLPEGLFGVAVALSSDGNTALIGSYAENNEVGAARVYTRAGFQQPYLLQEKLVGAGEVDKGIFGVSVALSSDGNTALIGGSGYHDIHFGEAWVFERPVFGQPYVLQQALIGADEIGEGRFGISAALECETALIGGLEDNSGVGAAWPFVNGSGPCPPHWYSNAEQIVPGEKVAVETSGTLTFTKVVGGETEVTCELRDHETIENPVGGGAGTDKLGQFALEACFIPAEDPQVCGAGTPEFKESGLSWPTQLIPGPMDEITGIDLELKCSGGLFLEDLTGSLTPTLSNGVLTFDAGSGSLTQSGYPGTTSVIGTDNLTGPVGDEHITAEELSRRVPEPPEFGRCITGPSKKEGKKTVYLGGFTAATCLVASGTRSGKYEWEPGIAKAPFKTTLASGPVTLESAVKTSKVTCKGEAGRGEYTGRKTVGAVTLTLTGCELVTAKSDCRSAGALAGEIVTNPLAGELGVEKLGATSATNKIGLDLYHPGKAGPLMEFKCGATAVTVQGSVIVPVKANKMSATQALKFKASKGKQKPEAFAGEAPDVLEESLDGAPFEQTGVTASLTLTSEEASEINSVV